MMVMNKIQNKEWKLDDKFVMEERDIDNRSGDANNLLGKNRVGTEFTIEELLNSVLVDSDNTAYNILFKNLKNEDVTSLVEDIGLDKLYDLKENVSAKEYSLILRSLYTANYLNRKNSQFILKLMNQSKFDEFLGKGIPSYIPFSHKYGENLKQVVFADSGIVYITNRPYLISVMIQGDKSKTYDQNEVKRVSEVMQNISNEVFTYFVNYKE
jgi:beta-lactamase class A